MGSFRCQTSWRVSALFGSSDDRRVAMGRPRPGGAVADSAAGAGAAVAFGVDPSHAAAGESSLLRCF